MASPDEPHPAAKPATPISDDPTHPDPLTGEPGAHPVGVGIGAVGTGVAGAVIGSLAGPVGALVGMAIGAVAGGLAGKEVAASDDETPPASHPATLAGAEGVLPGAGMSGMSGSYDASLPAATLVGAREPGVAGSNIDETTGVGAGQFHDAFTATTLRETEEENRLFGEDAPDPDPDLAVETGADEDLMDRTADLRAEHHLPSGETVVGGTPFGRANERHEHICTAAYYLYLARSGVGGAGDALGDWLAAEARFPME